MPSHSVTVPGTTDHLTATPAKDGRRVLVFSPDADLARFLLLNLEDRLQIVREHALTNFQEAIRQTAPHLILVDLCSFPEDIHTQLEILRHSAKDIPTIILRAYVALPPAMNKIIEQFAENVFYKPVDVTLITQAIEDRLKQEPA
jgi:DNA-binding NtrC family response regulator